LETILLFIVPAAWGAGRALRDRVLIAERLRARERELESERDAYAALSVRYERARIAAELHDIVAHAISVMVVQASAGQRLATRDRAATAETFEVIAGAARDAEVDMARLVALLADAPAGPDSDLALVDELVARANRAGFDVTLRVAGDVEDMDAEAAQLVRRVVQEGLTNALRYAAGAPVTVSVRGEPAAVAVEVINGPSSARAALRGAGTGNGLRGLRERVGGSVVAQATDDGGWRLAACVPRRVAMR
jgi:signal transduction histidine kinase